MATMPGNQSLVSQAPPTDGCWRCWGSRLQQDISGYSFTHVGTSMPLRWPGDDSVSKVLLRKHEDWSLDSQYLHKQCVSMSL